MHWTTLALLPLLSSASSLRTTRITTKFTPDCSLPSEPHDSSSLNEEFSVSLNVREGVCQGVPVPLPLGFYDEVDHISFEFEPLETVPETEAETETQTHAIQESSTPSPSPSPSPSLRHYGISSGSRTELGLTSREEAAAAKAAKANLDVCTVRLYERPGCSSYDTPLIQREFGAGAGIGGASQCVQRTRELIALEEVFVRVDCADGSGGAPRPTPSERPGEVHASASVSVTGSAVVQSGTPTPTSKAIPSPSSSSRAVAAADAGRWQKRRWSLLGHE